MEKNVLRIRKRAVIAIFLSIPIILCFIVPNFIQTIVQKPNMKNVSVVVQVEENVFDDLINWLEKSFPTFRNFTFDILPTRNTFNWFLENSTKIELICKYGEPIPYFNYEQLLNVTERTNTINGFIQSWKERVGQRHPRPAPRCRRSPRRRRHSPRGDCSP